MGEQTKKRRHIDTDIWFSCAFIHGDVGSFSWHISVLHIWCYVYIYSAEVLGLPADSWKGWSAYLQQIHSFKKKVKKFVHAYPQSCHLEIAAMCGAGKRAHMRDRTSERQLLLMSLTFLSSQTQAQRLNGHDQCGLSCWPLQLLITTVLCWWRHLEHESCKYRAAVSTT